MSVITQRRHGWSANHLATTAATTANTARFLQSAKSSTLCRSKPTARDNAIATTAATDQRHSPAERRDREKGKTGVRMTIGVSNTRTPAR